MKKVALDRIDQAKRHRYFALNFKEHVRTFIADHALIHPDKKLAVAVSGGVDSVALADVLASLVRDFEIIHFNHGTRGEESDGDEKLVRSLGERLNVPVNVFRFKLSLNEKNFEKKARDLRKSVFQDYIQRGYRVYTAHHIDDSFEWSLMQSFKQSGFKSRLGIPLFNRGIIRPFLCVTKKQILRFARAEKLEWSEDKSNQDTKFERNYMRAHLTSKILKKYPKALKYYVSRHNQEALMCDVHRLSMLSDFSESRDPSGAMILKSGDLKKYKNKIRDWVHDFSSLDRGEIDHELDKMLAAHKEIMQKKEAFPFKGPMSLSGGVELFLIRDHLFIGAREAKLYCSKYDRKLRHYLENLTQIPEHAVSLTFPFLVINGKKLRKSSKFIHPLLPLTCEFLKQQGISYTFAPLLGTHDRQLLSSCAVMLDSSLWDL